MLELLLCSLLTILPDYLYRRYGQGKRIGKEITLFSVWFELRWGIITCLMLTIGLITVIFYNHPSTTNATAYFRTVPILPETNGRVAEIFVDGVSGAVKQGAPIFRLDSSKQEAAAETARRRIAEVEAQLVAARTDVAAAEGRRSIAATRAPWPREISTSSKSLCKGAKEPLMPPLPLRNRRKRGSPRCCRPRRPVPRPSWLKPRWSWTRPWSVPA
jgi:hypothetical protein